MLRKYLPIILAASLISAAPSFAMAESSGQSPAQSSNDNSPSTQQPAQGNGGWHHGPPDPAQRTQELTKKLKLTSDQQTKVQDILQSEHTQMETLRQDNSTSQQDRHSKMMEIHQNSDTQIRALLDSTQQKKWEEMQAKREQWGQGHRHGAGDQQTPPPQP